MTRELRRSSRRADFLPITISVRRSKEKTAPTGLFSARVVDISRHGACLILDQVMMDSFHIFHSTREDDSCTLALHIELTTLAEPCTLEADPVWLDTTRFDNAKVFKMGIAFTTPISPDMLTNLTRGIKKHGG